MQNDSEPLPQITEELEVAVRRQWNDYKTATVKFDSITGLHYSSISGGVGRASPRLFLHGYISCDEILSGELAHSCLHGRSPHSIKVCIVKKDNEVEIYKRLSEKAK